jgi:O-6-methylguanine DNA methyltransferase
LRTGCRHIAGHLRNLLGSDEKALAGQLRSIFPQATLQKAGKEFDETLNHIVEYIDTPTGALALPLDIRGTAFQRRVWNALEDIPAGQTVTYKELALKLGVTAQEIGEACAANAHAVAIPCHRVVRSGGEIAGYRWGVNRKRLLLQREQERFPDPQVALRQACVHERAGPNLARNVLMHRYEKTNEAELCDTSRWNASAMEHSQSLSPFWS